MTKRLDELSKKTLKSYIKKANSDGAGATFTQGKLYGKELATKRKSIADKEASKAAFNKFSKRQKGISKAVDKLCKEDVEPINELSRETLKSYVKKGVDSLDKIDQNTRRYDRNMRRSQERWARGSKRTSPANYWDDLADKSDKKYNKRAKYMKKAIHKIAYNEDVEPLTELSKRVLSSYISSTMKNDRGKGDKHFYGRLKAHERIQGKMGAKSKTKGYEFKNYRAEDVEQIDEKTSKPKKYKYVSGFKPTNSGAGLKKKAVDLKHQAGVYSRWKAKKDSEGKEAADKWLVNKGYNEDMINKFEELDQLNEDETNTDNPFQVARQNYDTLIQGALSGNAVDVRNAVNDIMVTKASEVVAAIKDEVSQTMFGTEENPEDGRPKGDDDDDEWTPEDDEELDDEDDDTEHPELDDDDESDDDFEDDDEVEGYDDDDDDLPEDDDDTNDEKDA